MKYKFKKLRKYMIVEQINNLNTKTITLECVRFSSYKVPLLQPLRAVGLAQCNSVIAWSLAGLALSRSSATH